MAQEKTQQECTANSKDKPPSSESTKFKAKKEKNYQTKVVIRRLPPTMTEDQFVDQISPMPENDYFYFVKGDLSLGLNSFSRAYINFLNPQDIFIFKGKFDDYVFVDSKGTEYPAIVEFAPFQKIPKKKSKKRDSKCGTLEQDPDYIKFVEKLNNNEEEAPLPSAEVYLETIEAREKELKANNGVAKMTTPLIDFIREKKQAQQKQREEKKEERKRREQERRRLREEARRKKKADKEKPVSKEQSDKETDDHPAAAAPVAATLEENHLGNVTVLKNPEREKERDKEAAAPQAVSKPAGTEYKPGFKPKAWSKFRDQEKSESQTNRCFSRKKNDSRDHRGADAKNAGPSSSKPHPSSDTEDLKKTRQPQEKTHEEVEDEDSKTSAESHFKEEEEEGKDARKVRNKDRPSLEIYRPGMRRLSTHRSSPHKELSTSASNSSTPSPTPVTAAGGTKTSPSEWST